MTKLLLVFLGSGIGGAARYGVNVWSLKAFGPGFPAGTLIVNVVGGLAMGLIAGWLAFRASVPWSQDLRLFLTTGILGGFTTFSAFSLDAVTLIERGDYGAAALYVVLSVVLSIAAVAVGLAVIRSFS
ncbi:fluoride efflux transporter CrcB [Phreatobacter cathodiphilus]|uniref:Fluoride-specific ion channel FluC n=1 Tax=Phreatobacter cathodiphilus TaxID=1868589 RepID=A0A2S0N947_9HYPH|nr:fluoride efflux transporter CrcB [Phreatobacter cathodiphilus]AVO44699.1 fluoride efflux transporter CrcB [Phreatobacter cathodiphilus]